MGRFIFVLGFAFLSAIFFIAQSGMRIKTVIQLPSFQTPNEGTVTSSLVSGVNSWMNNPAENQETKSNPGKHRAAEIPVQLDDPSSSKGPPTPENEIPKKFHFVFLSPGFPDEQPPVPEHYMYNLNGWRKLHPDYTFTLWNNKMMKDEFPFLPKLLENVTAMAWVSDLLRYHVVQKYGGIYLDMDIAPIRNLEILRTRFSPVFSDCEDHGKKGNNPRPPDGIEEYDMLNRVFNKKLKVEGKRTCRQVNNNVIGTVPNHPVLDCIIQGGLQKTREDLSAHRNPPYKLSRTGPHRWTRCIWEHPDVNILHKQLFHPCKFFDRNSCNPENYTNDPSVFGMHEWKGSWKHGGKGMKDTASEKIGVEGANDEDNKGENGDDDTDNEDEDEEEE